MTTETECPEFIELRACEALLNSPAYVEMTDEEKAAFFIRYNVAAAEALQAAGRSAVKVN